MWKVKLINGDEFLVTETEARALIAGMESRLPIDLGYIVVAGVSIACVADEEQMRIKTNRIINDENFKGLCAGNGRSIDLLNSRYSGDKYEKEWDEALAYKKKLNDNDKQLSTTD